MKPSPYVCLLCSICYVLVAAPALAAGDCSDFVDLTGLQLPIEVTGTTAGAVADYGPFAEEPLCWQGDWDANCAAGRDVTYKWTAPEAGKYTFTLFGSPSNADLLLYQFTCPDEPGYPDDFICGAHRSWMESATLWNVELAAGQEVLVVVDGWLIWNGDFTLGIDGEYTASDMVARLMDIHHFCGLSVACVWDGQGRYYDGIGLADVAGGVPIGEDHLFSVAGIAELVTVTALMQLWEQGLFDLDDPVDAYLPFAVRHPDYPEIPLTFRMVMSHVASLNDNVGIYNSVRRSDGTDSPVTPCEFAEGYVTPGGPYYGGTNFLPDAPGTVLNFNEFDATLMACLVEHIAPQALSFEDYCREHIFDPLQMPSSSFLLANIDPEDLVIHYYWSEHDQDYISQPHFTSPIYPSVYLRSNADELHRLLLAYLQGGELDGARILEPATIDTILTPHYPGISPFMGLIFYAQFVDNHEYWGFLSIYSGVRSRFCLSPDQGTGAVAVTNCSGVEGEIGITDITNSLIYWEEQGIPLGIGSQEPGAAVPSAVQLAPTAPNPFNPRTAVRFTLPDDRHVRLTIHDLGGRRVATLLDEALPAGRHEIVWNGRDDAGREAPSGVYLLRLEAGRELASGRLTLVR